MSTVKDLIDMADRLFSKRESLITYWQHVAEQFYPERAEFTSSFTLGEEFSDHLTSSYPVMARRELGGTISSLLRPRDVDWFEIGIGEDDVQGEARQWLQTSTKTMRNAMYDPKARFVRATKEGDHDFAAFGQCVISAQIRQDRDGFIFKNWHLRDCAWRENDDGEIDTIVRKWKPTAIDLQRMSRWKIHHSVDSAVSQKDQWREVNCMHVVQRDDGRFPWRSTFVDVDNQHIMSDEPSLTKIYVIPRWQTVSGSQYAYSPATVAALPDARLLQAITLTLLDAGEMYAAPPMLAVKEALRSDIDLRSRGITYVEQSYDWRTGQPLQPLEMGKHGYPIGAEMREEVRDAIASAFFLNKLQLPPADGREMTAFEVSERIKEFVRTTMPMFEPMEEDYNGQLCEAVFELGMPNQLFGPLDQIPKALRDRDVKFTFQSPLSDARDRAKAGTFIEAKNLLLEAAQIDPSALKAMDVVEALRDALRGIRSPEDWIVDPQIIAAQMAEEAEAVQAAQQMQGLDMQAGVMSNVAQANMQLEEAGLAA